MKNILVLVLTNGVEESQEWYDEFAEEPLLKQIKELYPTKEGLRKLVDDLLSPVK